MNRVVALRSCPDYHPERVQTAVNALWEDAQAPSMRGKTILLKPNLLKAARPEEAVSTHPEVLRALIRRIKKEDPRRIIVGESPGYQGFELAAKKCGILEVVDSEGVEFDDFSQAVEVDNPSGLLVKSFKIAKAVRDADILISLPKLKTHSLMRYTGALKNLFGVVPGFDKAAYHFRFKDVEHFGQMLVDLNLCLKSGFALMDAVVGMEGPGPGSGDPRQIGVLAASSNLLALDRLSCRLIGYDPDDISYLKQALDSGHWLKAGEEELIVGDDIHKFMVPGFKLLKESQPISFRNKIPGPLHNLIQGALTKRPAFRHKKCILCSGCVKICPAHALRIDKKVEIDLKACIRCYCCHEVCPVDAIKLRRF